MSTFGSVCSGIEAASVAWHPLGWRAAWLAEIEPFPAAVLAHHYPSVPNLGDMTKLPRLVLTGKAAAPDVLVGGTPCQAFSVAGMREGLNDPRGQLTIKFVELADTIDHVRAARGDDPAIIVWENVPGVLSDRGNAFGCFLGALSGEDCELQPAGGKWSNAGCVFGPKRTIAWRVLDAQYFGVAQRRRRVFVVASARDGFNPAQVLFEFGGLRRDTPPRRGKGPTVAALTANGVGTCGADDNQGQAGHLIPAQGCWWDGGQVSQTLDAVLAKGQTMPEKNRFPAVLQPIAFHPTQDPIHSTDGSTHAMGRGSSGGQASIGVAYGIRTANTSSNGWGIQEEVTHTLDRAMGQAVAVSLRGRDGGATAELGDEVQNCLRASSGGGDKAHVLAPVCVTGEVAHTIKAEGFDGSEDGTGRGQPIVAFTTEQTPKTNSDCALTLTKQSPTGGGQIQSVLTAEMAVRRLTPRECERLQGFPDIVKTCIITVNSDSNSSICYLDQPSTFVLAAHQSHKSPNNALHVEECASPSIVRCAKASLNAGQAKSSAPVLVSARIDLERQHLQILSQGGSLLSVSIADAKEWCRLPIRADDFVQLSVALLACLEKMAPTGRAALHLNTSGSFPLLSGNWFASQSGREIEELASDAEKFMSAVKKCTTFITSEAGRNFQNYDSNLQTLLCCVSTVISSFIPSEIRSANSYALSIEVSHGYTLIPWRNKPAEECPDGPRYKALGNSMAVPCMAWIGIRIKMALEWRAAA